MLGGLAVFHARGKGPGGEAEAELELRLGGHLGGLALPCDVFLQRTWCWLLSEKQTRDKTGCGAAQLMTLRY